MRFSYIVVFVIIIMLGIAGYFIFFRPMAAKPIQKTQSAGNAQRLSKVTPLPPASIPTGEKIEFGTPHGSIEVNNFYKAAKGYEGDALVIRQTAFYEIIFDGLDSVFGIYITGGSISTSRA